MLFLIVLLGIISPAPLLALTFPGSAGGFAGLMNNIPVIIDEEPEVEEEFIGGETPANIIIERIVSYPETGSTDLVILRNTGGQIADLTGWTMTDSKPEPMLIFGEPGCEGNATIYPQSFLELAPISADNPCGFPFGISFRDSILLFTDKGNLVGNVTWATSEKGSSIRLINDVYVLLTETTHIMDTLRAIPDFSIFVRILEETRTDKILDNDVNPGYTGVKLPSPPSPDYQIEFPWWFGFATDRTLVPPSPPPPPPPPSPPNGEVPDLGPYTIFAPTNAAFDELLLLLGGGRVKVPLQAFLKLPELEQIMQYHIAYGAYTTDFMFNNTGIRSALGPEVVVMKDPRWTEGLIALSDACVDKPTSGYPCDMQLEFNKCFEPFMISPLAAGWQGGFCQKTCGRCTCNEKEGGTCAKIQYPDVVGGNGVVHGISRVMFPPPMFDDIEEVTGGPTPEVSEDMVIDDPLIGSGAIPVLPTLPPLPRIPGLT